MGQAASNRNGLRVSRKKELDQNQGLNNFGMRRTFFWFVSGITFLNYRDYIVNKSQTIDCLLTLFLKGQVHG